MKTRTGSASLQLAGFAIVALTMAEMFSVPKNYFVFGSIVATVCMISVSLFLANYKSLFTPTSKSIAIGFLSAAILYLIFLGGNALVKSISPLGIGALNETSIYSLFSSTPPALRVAVFVLDAVGFESYFRGVLQRTFSARLGVGSAFAAALIDAAIHISTLNPLFVITTFIADSVWGLNYYLRKDLTSNIISHFVWDFLIFIVFPIS